jgi:magnesium-transporting ATPase (P-type)
MIPVAERAPTLDIDSGVSIVHALRGRLRVRVPALKGARALTRALETALAGAPSIGSASGNPATGTLLILCEGDATTTAILEAVEKALARARRTPSRSDAIPRRLSPWHLMSAREALRRLRSSLAGLSAKTFQRRLARYGENALPSLPARNRLEIFVEQFNSLPVALLIGAAALSIMTGGAADAVVVLSVVALNAGIGFVTEAQADRALRELSTPLSGTALVVREGSSAPIPIRQVAPGDILDLRPGAVVAADARVVAAQGLMINEATLTGESAPSSKSPEALAAPHVAVADRSNMVYRGTTVTGGSGLAVVVATGGDTEIGQLHSALETAQAPDTPLQKQLDRLGRQLTLLAGGACAFVFLIGLLRGYGLFATFRNAIALTVAAIPEGLGGRRAPLTPQARHAVQAENDRLAGAGRRVLGVACKTLAPGASEGDGYVFLGLVGLADPLRPGVGALLARLRAAGISPVMITGDQKATAAAIARELGFADGALRIIEPDALADGWRGENLTDIPHVFARVTPGQKLEIVRALQAAGHVVAMTGDGVNDSPALRAADIGVAMGRSGSEAAREAAHIILEDDNLDALVPAIERGRATAANIRRAIRYLLATNMSEILLMTLAPAANLGQPLTPAQLLWINLVTDVAPALALGLEPPHRDVMRAAPAEPNQNIVDAKAAASLARQGGLIAAGALGAYAYGYARFGPTPRARSICFTTIIAGQLLHALSCRSETHGFASRSLPPNRSLYAVVAGSMLLQGAAMFIPPLRRLLGLSSFAAGDLGVAIAAALAPFAANESVKLLASAGAEPESATIGNDGALIRGPAGPNASC